MAKLQMTASEYNLLLTTVILALAMLFSSFFLLAVESYNESVAQAEAMRKYETEGKEGAPNFTIAECTFGATYPHIWSRFHSLLWLPFVFLAFWRKKLSSFVWAFIFNLFPFINFLYWLYWTSFRWEYFGKVYNENYRYFGDPILINSNSFDKIVFVLISLLFVWQAAILFRFFVKITKGNRKFH